MRRDVDAGIELLCGGVGGWVGGWVLCSSSLALGSSMVWNVLPASVDLPRALRSLHERCQQHREPWVRSHSSPLLTFSFVQ